MRDLAQRIRDFPHISFVVGAVGDCGAVWFWMRRVKSGEMPCVRAAARKSAPTKCAAGLSGARSLSRASKVSMWTGDVCRKVKVGGMARYPERGLLGWRCGDRLRRNDYPRNVTEERS